MLVMGLGQTRGHILNAHIPEVALGGRGTRRVGIRWPCTYPYLYTIYYGGVSRRGGLLYGAGHVEMDVRSPPASSAEDGAAGYYDITILRGLAR